MYMIALKHHVTYEQGEYRPAVVSFLNVLMSIKATCRWKLTVVFDGQPPAEKADEHRRREKEGRIRTTSLYIALCAYVCRRQFFDYGDTRWIN